MNLAPYSEPEPDLILLRPQRGWYRGALPVPEDVLLLVEFSDTSLRFDGDVKLPLCAAASIPEVRIMDLPRKRVLMHRRPEHGAYREVTVIPRDGGVAPAAFPDLVLPLTELFG